ncbi:hypothetical protein NDA14_004582 [Ustilago hordei]|uniref:Uncharacterized protein n=1 Tax=Ustilago hordei TaxID=120017 RepID=I2G1B5_USTHO|nr:hypothetical protein NDA10_007669 [Ustilago hordei]KAJ1599890.1 hypothetical protein NDA14_004582 [Ustilago hordei]UTT92308.1 hypothetical protein NDA17_005197 [Ustilago hordei]CCF52958.1 uncharacterized protein UHOR_15756 [Ustilago hordei]
MSAENVLDLQTCTSTDPDQAAFAHIPLHLLVAHYNNASDEQRKPKHCMEASCKQKLAQREELYGLRPHQLDPLQLQQHPRHLDLHGSMEHNQALPRSVLTGFWQRHKNQGPVTLPE